MLFLKVYVPCFLLVILFLLTRKILFLVIPLIVLREKFLPIVIFIVLVMISIVFSSPSLYRLSVRFYFDTFGVESNFDKLPEPPYIIMSNYNSKSNVLSYTAHLLFPHNPLLISSNVYKGFLDRIYKKGEILYVSSTKRNYNDMRDKISQETKKGKSVFCYIEDMKNDKKNYSISELRSGIFSIAKELKIPIVPVVMDTLVPSDAVTMGKFRIIVGDHRKVENVKTCMTDVLRWMKNKLDILKIRK